MCGRYTDTRRDKQFLVRMGIEQAEIDFVPRFNLAPTQIASVIASDENGRPELRRSRWGLIPFWAKDEKIGNSLVNARAEGIATKPAFRASFLKRRCLVLADGFYEWKKLPGGKQPMYIHMRDRRPFVFGGVWDRWNGVESFSIITVPPNELVSSIHDRMPLIIPEDSIDQWLNPKTPSEDVSALLQPYSGGEMAYFPVSPIVNTAKLDSAECIQPVDPEAKLTLQRPSRKLRREDGPLLPGFG